MSDEPMTRSLLWANLAIERIDRALRQMDRLQNAYAALCAEGDRVADAIDYPRAMPKSWTDLNAVFEDNLYFLIIAARQALKAVWLMEERGETMPRIRQSDLIRSWRDYAEHWDAAARGQPDRARRAWQAHSDEEEPSLTYSGVDDEVHEVSGVQMHRLRKDLEAARKAVRRISEREWLHCYITAEEAAEILGMSLDEFESQPLKPTHMDFEGMGGVRYFRDWVEARRDGRGIPPGWGSYVSGAIARDE